MTFSIGSQLQHHQRARLLTVAMLCNILFFTLFWSARADDLQTDPCPNDTTGYCMNQYAIKYTNQLREAKSVPPLVSGSVAMFQNAMRHSKVQDQAVDIFHQPIENGIQVGSGDCRQTLHGENVATYMHPRINNAAMYCVMDLWKNSPGHYANMVNAKFKSVVVAIHRHNGRITCTQTFSITSTNGSGECAPALPHESDTNSGHEASKKETGSHTSNEKHAENDSSQENHDSSPTEHHADEAVQENHDTRHDEPATAHTEVEGSKNSNSDTITSPTIPDLQFESITVTTSRGSKKELHRKCFQGHCYYCAMSNPWCYRRADSYNLDMFLMSYGF